MARFKCPVCGYIYDEEKVGAPFDPDSFSCPICGVSGVTFIRLDDEDAATSASPAASGAPSTSGAPAASASPSASGAPAASASPATSGAPSEAHMTSLAYDPRYARTDPAIRHMDDIHEMAAGGSTISGAMGTQLPLPSWDDILILGAQLAPMPLASDAKVSTTTVIGKNARQPLMLENPVFVSHMSFGALSREAKLALARGSAAAHAAMCSGEGGILPEEKAAAYKYIFEYVPNRYSVTDESLKTSDAVEIKIGQGTKPGMGGHLPGHKVTADIAAARGKEPGRDVISPSRFPGIDTPEDLKALVDELRARSEGRPIGIKLAAGHLEADLEAAIFAGPDYVTIDGRGGATGSSPKLLRDATSVPTIYALARARAYLDEHAPDTGLVITGGLRVSSDICKAIAMGADAVALASASLMAIGCQQYRICGSDKCPVGIATQDPKLRARFDVDKGAARLENFFNCIHSELETFCRISGHEDLFDFSYADLVTTSRDIAEHTPIAFV